MKPLPYLMCHPDTFEFLKKQFEITIHPSLNDIVLSLDSFSGIEIKTSPTCPRFVEKRWWEFPNDQFIEYEPSDEIWCRYFGFGKERVEITDQPYIVEIHPPDCFNLRKIWE